VLYKELSDNSKSGPEFPPSQSAQGPAYLKDTKTVEGRSCDHFILWYNKLL